MWPGGARDRSTDLPTARWTKTPIFWEYFIGSKDHNSCNSSLHVSSWCANFVRHKKNIFKCFLEKKIMGHQHIIATGPRKPCQLSWFGVLQILSQQSVGDFYSSALSNLTWLELLWFLNISTLQYEYFAVKDRDVDHLTWIICND